MSSTDRTREWVLKNLAPGQVARVDAIHRYGVGQASAFQLITGSTTMAAEEKSLKRLRQRGVLKATCLPGCGNCYTLSPETVLSLGLSKRARRSMGPGSMIGNLAMLLYCVRRGVTRLTREEVRATYPELDRPGLQVGNYYTDFAANPPRLTWMQVDHASSPAALGRKASAIIRRAYRFPSLRQLVTTGQYAIVLLVPNERKKWLVEQVLAKHFFARVAVSVEVIPELQALLLS